MAKKSEVKKDNGGGIQKMDFAAIKAKHNAQFKSVVKTKEQTYFNLGEDFLDIVGLPGPALGHINLFYGHSDTGKTTALVKTAIEAQKRNILPVFIITEQKWSWEHAKLMGFEVTEVVDEETGEISHDGFFFFNNTFQTVEQIGKYINELLDQQAKGDLPLDLLFLWDSVGSVPCQLTFEGKGGKQHTAGVLSEIIGMGLNQRITGSRRVDSEYTNTLVIVNQPWVFIDMKNPRSQPKIKPKGGNAIYLNSTLVFLFGNQQDAGTSKISAQKDGRKISYATRTKISIVKNHINGLGYIDGRIIATPHGFIKDTDAAINQYKKDYKNYWEVILGGEFDIVKEARAASDIQRLEDFVEPSDNDYDEE